MGSPVLSVKATISWDAVIFKLFELWKIPRYSIKELWYSIRVNQRWIIKLCAISHTLNHTGEEQLLVQEYSRYGAPWVFWFTKGYLFIEYRVTALKVNESVRVLCWPSVKIFIQQPKSHSRWYGEYRTGELYWRAYPEVAILQEWREAIPLIFVLTCILVCKKGVQCASLRWDHKSIYKAGMQSIMTGQDQWQSIEHNQCGT